MHNKNLALEGLRGVASLVVILSHAAFGFLPYLHTGNPSDLRMAQEEWLFISPFRFIYSGELAVCIFFVLSGYVLARRFLSAHDVAVLEAAASKRWFRLGIPVAAAVLCGYLIMKTQGVPPIDPALPPTFPWACYHFQPSLWAALSDAAYRALLFPGGDNYDYVLWTIRFELYGSFFLFSFLALFGRLPRCWFSALVAMVVFVLMTLNDSLGPFLAMFLIGAVINYARWPQRAWLSYVAFALGLFIGGYDWNSPIYSPLVKAAGILTANLHIALNWPMFFRTIGALLIVLAVSSHTSLGVFFSTRLITRLGRLSFGVYLLHSIILASIGARVFTALHERIGYIESASVATATTIAATIAVSEIFARLIDEPAIRASNTFGRFISDAIARLAAGRQPQTEPQ